jgi:hypothetical protein
MISQIKAGVLALAEWVIGGLAQDPHSVAECIGVVIFHVGDTNHDGVRSPPGARERSFILRKFLHNDRTRADVQLRAVVGDP